MEEARACALDILPVGGEENEAAPRRGISVIQIPVECQKCGRKFEKDHHLFAPNPISVRTKGAIFAPYLQKILDEEFGPQPDLIPIESDPPKDVPSCSACRRRERVPQEGDTFRKRSHRGKLKTFGRLKGSPLPELDPDRTGDHVDQALTEAYRKSRYSSGLDYANEQSGIRERLGKRENIQVALGALRGMSLRDMERKWGIPRTTAARAKNALETTSASSD